MVARTSDPDYRFTWLRNASTTLAALLGTGYRQEARAWRRRLLRAVAGDPEDLQLMYVITGERDLRERELSWLPGYEGSTPVRVGDGATDQLRFDVYGEVIETLNGASQGKAPAPPPPFECCRRVRLHGESTCRGDLQVRG